MPGLALFAAAREHCKGARILRGRGLAGAEQEPGEGGQGQEQVLQEPGDKGDNEWQAHDDSRQDPDLDAQSTIMTTITMTPHMKKTIMGMTTRITS